MKKRVAARVHAFFMSAGKRWLLLPLLSIAMLAPASADQRFQLLQQLSAAGAPQLGIRMLDQAQPDMDQDLYQWILWEQERFAMLARWQEWDALLLRIENLPQEIPEQFRQQAVSYKAQALLESGQIEAARRLLVGTLWQEGASDSAEIETWRRQVIRSYLKQGNRDDARIAMLRFEQDFESNDAEWILSRSEVLIETARYDQALQLLQGASQWQAEYLRLLAAFRAGQVSSAELKQTTKSARENSEVSDDQLAALDALDYEAATLQSLVNQVIALEAYFGSGLQTSLRLLQIPVDVLWQGYAEYARLVGNRAELLQGDDEQWLQLGRNSKGMTPIKARSLFAMLMLDSSSTEIRNLAASEFLTTFNDPEGFGQRLLQALFSGSRTFAEASTLPEPIRYHLVDQALRNADIDEATRLMSGLSSIPEGVSEFDWQLRQARVLILGGEYSEGSRVLQRLIEQYSEPDTQSTDRIIQVLFDLQSVQSHREAIVLFNQLLRFEIEAKQRREILFWLADSYKGLEQHDRAALLYLQSAMLPGPQSMDPWAQTARFNAAESLQEAGFIDDARRVYQQLLKSTEDPARRAVLNSKMQQLWLFEKP